MDLWQCEPGSTWGLPPPSQELCLVGSGSSTLTGKTEGLQVLKDVEEESWVAPMKPSAATRRCAQQVTWHLVLMNSASCHYAPHVPEPNCLFIHYLLCSSNKAELVWDTLRRLQKIWTVVLSRANHDVPALKGNGPTHRLADLKGWLTNTLGRKATEFEGECLHIFCLCFTLFFFSPTEIYSLPCLCCRCADIQVNRSFLCSLTLLHSAPEVIWIILLTNMLWFWQVEQLLSI